MTSNLTTLNRKYLSGSPPENNLYLSSTILFCASGFIFSDFSAEHVINCTAAATWSIIPNCIRKHLFAYFFMCSYNIFQLMKFIGIVDKGFKLINVTYII